MNYSLRLLRVLIITALALVTLHLLFKYISVVGFSEQSGFFYELSSRFDINDENSVPQWFSQFLLLGLGAMSFLIAYMDKDKKAKTFWNVVGVLGVIMSIDHVATIHEFTLQTLHNIFFRDQAPSLLANSWLIILPLVLALAVWLLRRAILILPRRALLLLLTAGGIFLSGSVGVDSLANTMPPREFANQGLLGGLEGFLEYIGLVLAVYVVADYLETNYKRRLIKALAVLRSAA